MFSHFYTQAHKKFRKIDKIIKVGKTHTDSPPTTHSQNLKMMQQSTLFIQTLFGCMHTDLISCKHSNPISCQHTHTGCIFILCINTDPHFLYTHKLLFLHTLHINASISEWNINKQYFTKKFAFQTSSRFMLPRTL